MDIQIFENDSLKIKIKKTTLAVDPKQKISKFDADAVLIMDQNCDVSRINNYRVVIDEAGEYEIAGLKVLGIKTDKNVIYGLNSENVDTLVASVSSLETISKDKLSDYQVIILNVDSDLNQSVVTAMEPRVVILYGEKAKEGVKAMGKENAIKASKISLSEDKLPEELDVMLLA